MTRFITLRWLIVASAVLILSGCHPTQPAYFSDDGDLSHYISAAQEIEYPDVNSCSLQEVEQAEAPLTLDNSRPREMWDLELQEAMKNALANSKVLRTLAGRFQSLAQVRPQVGEAPDVVTNSPNQVQTIYDPAIQDASPGDSANPVGVEAALSAFDTQLSSNLFWQKNDHPQNVQVTGPVGALFTPVFRQDDSTANIALSKVTATGGRFAVRNNYFYDANNNPTRQIPSDWNVNFEMAFEQPLLQSAGVLYNRIAGPFVPGTSIGDSGSQFIDGVMIARINSDITLANFEAGVRNMVSDVENAYWELYFAYRYLDAAKSGRDSALQTWRKIYALYKGGARGGEAEKEAQSREQYFFFRSQVEQALTDLYRAENRLRYIMGLSVSDGRLIRPKDEPTTAKVSFDWCEIHAEGLARSAELREQKWEIKKVELELIAARNLVQPRLDAVGRYRWLGLGDDLINSNRAPVTDQLAGTNAFQSLTSGDFQEWELGLRFSLPIGFRRELARVRYFQLQKARACAVLQDQELELSHQLGDALRSLDSSYILSQTNFNRRVAAQKQVEAVDAAYQVGTVTLDLLLEAQRRRAEAEIAYYRALVDYSRSVVQVHFRKGSLLEYNNVYLAEGPWPAKALWDAQRLARERDASHYFDYGYTRPKVISRGPYLQHADDAEMGPMHQGGDVFPGDDMPGIRQPEEVPTPSPAPAGPIPTPARIRSPQSHPSAPMRAATQPSPVIKHVRVPGGETSEPTVGPTLQQPQARATSAKESQGGFDWGSLGLNSESHQDANVGEVRQANAAKPESTKPVAAKQTPKTASAKPASGSKPRQVREPGRFHPEAEPRPLSITADLTPTSDSGVRQTNYQDWKPTSGQAPSADASGANDRSGLSWQPVKR